METILNAFSEIANVLPRIDRLKATFGDEAEFQQVLGLIYSDLMEFHKRAYKIFRRKSWHFWFAVNWALFERRFKSVLDSLASHCDLLDREAAAIHFSSMKQMRDKRQLEEDEAERSRNNRMFREVLGWLTAEDISQEEHLHRISDNRQPETCNWVLDDAQICSWIEDDNGDAVVWMTGIPGAGKSYLCSLIIENLKTRQNLASLYFFCAQPLSDQSRCASLLRTLTFQILQPDPDVALLVHQAYLQKGLSCSYPTIKRILKEVLPLAKNTRIVVDGIDEYDGSDQQEILKCLLDLQKSMGGSCKLLISSREEPSIGILMPRKIHFKLDGKTAEGLNLYIRDKVEELKNFFQDMDPSLLVRVKNRLEEKAERMFLWVRLVSTMLKRRMSERDFEVAIEQLPEGIGEAYGRILSRFHTLDSYLKDRVFRILSWMCVAYRPIGIHELVDGISLKPGQKLLGKNTRSNDPKRDIVELCAPLMEMSSNGTLSLVHFTAKEYLLHEQSGRVIKAPHNQSIPFIETHQAHFSIAFSCITNLNSALAILPRFNKGVAEADVEKLVVQGCFGLQPYAHQFWAEHLIAFLGETRGLDGETAYLIGALEEFSRARKGGQAEISFRPNPSVDSKGLHKLEKFPLILHFVSCWLHFKSKLNKELPSFTDIPSQEQWRLQTDETFLSLIDSRLREITERLLIMKSSALPPHIDGNDHKLFASRFRIACRFLSCNYDFDSTNARDAHEMAHLTSFPCPKCDFAERGFKSRRDLEKHTRKYHMSPEDFEIPSSLSVAGRSLRSSKTTSERFSRSRCWNEQGRKDIQQCLQRVYAKIESTIGLEGHQTEQRKSGQSDTGVHISGSASSVKLSNIWDKIEGQQYHTLTNFRDDVRELLNAPDDCAITQNSDFEEIYEQELEKAMSGFPALANFDYETRKHGTNEILSVGDHDSIQKGVKALNEHEPVSSGTDYFSKRKPYWSLAEEAQFPKLLEQYGRNLIKIADYLRTKTVDEIDQHLTENIDLSNLASAADARCSLESQSTHLAPEKGDSQPEKVLVNEADQMTRIAEPGYFRQISNETETYLHHQQDSSRNANKDVNSSSDSNESQPNIGNPKRPKRPAPPRQRCPYCFTHPEGLRDEYTLQKHIGSFHMPTRSVWICNDDSIDKKFLTNCKSCSKGKRYKSKGGAGKHLRLEHFSKTMPMEKLFKWMRETEEPNPNFKSNASNPSSANFDNQAPDKGPPNKRQKTGGKPPSPQKSGILNSANLLPAMRSSPRKSKTPENQDLDEDSSDSSSTGSDDIAFFPEVSFSNFLPGQVTESREMITEGPPHRKTPAFIRLDQVQRLPHLNHNRKAACHDQVEAYYQILDNETVGSPKYEETLKSLSSLSKTLLRDLRDWRRHSAQAPNIPFSI